MSEELMPIPYGNQDMELVRVLANKKHKAIMDKRKGRFNIKFSADDFPDVNEVEK